MRTRQDEPLTGQDVARSNTTLNTFFGGKQKAWMSGTANSPRTHATALARTTSCIPPSPPPSDESSPARQIHEPLILNTPLSAITHHGRTISAGANPTREAPHLGPLDIEGRGIAHSNHRPTPDDAINQTSTLSSLNRQAQASGPNTGSSIVIIDEQGSQNAIKDEGDHVQAAQITSSRIDTNAAIHRGLPVQSTGARHNEEHQQGFLRDSHGSASLSNSNNTPVPMGPRDMQQRHAQALPMPYPSLSSPSVSSPYQSTANYPSLKPHIQIIDRHITAKGGPKSLLPLELARFTLLRNACNNQDYFYVILHQIFCLWSIDSEILLRIPELQDLRTALSAFRILALLIRENSDMQHVHLEWFSLFPGSFETLVYHSNHFRDSIPAVIDFMQKLAREWKTLNNVCLRHGRPPLIDEMIASLGLLSPVLQGVVFSAVRRNVGFQDDIIGNAMEEVFATDRDGHQDFALRCSTAYPPTEQEIFTRNAALTAKYKELCDRVVRRRSQVESHNSWDNSSSVPNDFIGSTPGQANQSISLLQRENTSSFSPLTFNVLTSQVSPKYPSPIDSVRITSPRGMPQQSGDMHHVPSQSLTQDNSRVPPQQSHGSQPPLNGPTRPQYHQSAISSNIQHDPAVSNVQTMPLAMQRPDGRLPRQLAESGNPARSTSQTSVHSPTIQRQYQFRNESTRSVYPAREPQGSRLQGLQEQENNTASSQRSQNQVHEQSRGMSTESPSRSYRGSQMTSRSGTSDQQAMMLSPPVLPISQNITGLSSDPDMVTNLGRTQNYNVQHPMVRSVVPPYGWSVPSQPPNPGQNALHQSHLRSPLLVVKDDSNSSIVGERYYRVVRSFPVMPTLLPSSLGPISKYTFQTQGHDFEKMVISPYRTTSQLISEISVGSVQYRLRCVQVKEDVPTFPESKWVVAETRWPVSVFIDVNDQSMEIRRKQVYGKDLPIDITNTVASQGPNGTSTVKITVLKSGKSSKELRWAFAVEVVEVLRHSSIVESCLKRQRIPRDITLDSIKDSLSGGPADDDDLAMLATDLTIDIADPFMATVFKIPVRGASCLHRECFDLETFLNTRPGKPKLPNYPSQVDVWKCPLCGRDARPSCLRVDEFLLSVRYKLETDESLNVKAIIVSPDGTWKPKTDPGSTRKRSSSVAGLRCDENDSDDGISVLQSPPRKVSTIEIIELDN